MEREGFSGSSSPWRMHEDCRFLDAAGGEVGDEHRICAALESTLRSSLSIKLSSDLEIFCQWRFDDDWPFHCCELECVVLQDFSHVDFHGQFLRRWLVVREEVEFDLARLFWLELKGFCVALEFKCQVNGVVFIAGECEYEFVFIEFRFDFCEVSDSEIDPLPFELHPDSLPVLGVFRDSCRMCLLSFDGYGFVRRDEIGL